MARFIVDVANVKDVAQVKAICEAICNKLNDQPFSSGVISANCIDGTNKNQFYEVGDSHIEDNFLNREQLDNFKKITKGEEFKLKF